MNWKNYLAGKKSRTEFILTIFILAAVLFSLAKFLDFVEARQGIVLNDPVLSLFQPVDLTWLIFSLIYLSLFLALIELVRKPSELMLALQSYSLMVIFRIVAMYVMPLNPPVSMIALNDPFVQFFGTGKMLTKDLFFSGHTATLFLLFLVTGKKWLRNLFLIFTAAVGISVLLQHVHYTIDVFAAPFFAYASFRIITLIRKNLQTQIES